MGNRSGRLGVSILLCAVILSQSGCDPTAGTRRFAPVRGPLIGVLRQFDHSIVLLDPATLEVRGTIPLASQSLDFDVAGRTLITAQCGLHGRDIGREVGFADLETGQLEYVKLSGVDPLKVHATGDGWALVETGMIDAEGQRLHRVDIDSRSVEDLSVAPATGAAAATSRHVWVAHSSQEGGDSGAAQEYLVFGRAGDERHPATEEGRVLSVCGFDSAVVSLVVSGPQPRLVRREALSGSVEATCALDLRQAPVWAWSAGRYVVVAESDSMDLFSVSRLVVFDADTLEPRGVLADLPGASAVTATDGGVLVVCHGDGTVSSFDVSNGLAPLARTGRIGDERGDLIDAEYIP